MNQAESNKEHGDKSESRGLKPAQGDRAEKKASSEASHGMEAHSKDVAAKVQEKRISRKSGATASGFQSADSLLPAEKSKSHKNESAKASSSDSHAPHHQDGKNDSGPGHKQDAKADSNGHKPEGTGKQAAESAINSASKEHHPATQNAERKQDHPADLAANALKSVFNLGQSIGKEADHLVKQAGQAEKQFEKSALQFGNGIKDGASNLVKQGEQGLHQVADGAGNTLKAIDKTAHQIQHNVDEGFKSASHQVGEHTNNILKTAKHVQHRFQEGTEHAVKEVGKEFGKIEHDVTKGARELGKVANEQLKANAEAGLDLLDKGEKAVEKGITSLERQAVVSGEELGRAANEAVHVVMTKAKNAGDIGSTIAQSVGVGGQEMLDGLGKATKQGLTTMQEHPVETVVTVVGVGSALALAGVIEVGSGGTATPLLVAAGTAAVEFVVANGATIGTVATLYGTGVAMNETIKAKEDIDKHGELNTLWNQENHSAAEIQAAKNTLIKDTSKAAFEDTAVAVSFATMGAGSILKLAKTSTAAAETVEAASVGLTEAGAACTEAAVTDAACANQTISAASGAGEMAHNAGELAKHAGHVADGGASAAHTGSKLPHVFEGVKGSTEIVQKTQDTLKLADEISHEEKDDAAKGQPTSQHKHGD